ncbi:MAG: hypothetical protein ACJAZ1_001538 [Yoonia sp.]
MPAILVLLGVCSNVITIDCTAALRNLQSSVRHAALVALGFLLLFAAICTNDRYAGPRFRLQGLDQVLLQTQS